MLRSYHLLMLSTSRRNREEHPLGIIFAMQKHGVTTRENIWLSACVHAYSLNGKLGLCDPESCSFAPSFSQCTVSY